MCSDIHLIDKLEHEQMSLDECFNFCNEDSNCNFYDFGLKNNGFMHVCRKYTSCSTSRIGNRIVDTYSKDGDCSGN